MKNKLFQMFALTVVVATLGSFALAQDRSKSLTPADKYLISAKAGGVNYTEGAVNIVRADGKSGLLIKGDQIEIGDIVSTAADGRIEILLNPGSYLRLGSNSTLKFKTTSLDDLRIILLSGSAIFEVFATEKFRVNVITPKEHVAMIESGVYRVDLGSGGSGKVSVNEGKAVVGLKNLTVVKRGSMASFGNNSVTVTKIDRDNKDYLAKWSKSRAKDLAKMTASLRNTNVRNSLMNSFNRGGWNLYNSFGLWINDPFSGMSCFLPFGRGWYSPYGYGYLTDLYWFNPHYIPPSYIPPNNPPINPPQGDLGRRKPVDDVTSPFVAVERQQRLSNEERRQPADEEGSGARNDDRRYSHPSEQKFPSESQRPSSPPISLPPILPPPPHMKDKPIDN